MSYWLHRIKYGPYFRLKKHLFDIHLYSLEAYNSFITSKACRLLIRLGLFTGSYNSPIGLYLWLSSQKDFNKKALEELNDNNLKHLSKVCELHLFQRVRSISGKIGTFLGILVTHEDYYYILMDDYGNKWYETCCSKLEFLKD